MLSNLASYLGYVSSSAEKAQAAAERTDVRLRAVEEDDDWVLVERNDQGSSVATIDGDDEAGMTRVTLAISTCPSSLPGSSKGLARSSLDIPCHLQESWYLTPPPSFISEGPVHMETSPLENLLIEHPSMSVYKHTQRAGTPRRKSSNPSPSSSPTSEEEPTLRPSPKPHNKLPRNKLNTKFSKKLSTKRPQAGGDADDDVISSESEGKVQEVKEPKMKSFVKSPRRSINAELKALSKKPPQMISTPSEEPRSAVQNVQTRKLYSEVLASKPKVPDVQTAPAKPEETAPSVAEEPTVAAAENESIMSIEEAPEESADRNEIEADRRRTVQTISDQQHRQHFLNRSAQKVEQRKTCDSIKRNPLIRTNKAREINFRNKRQRRADMMQRHSGANNNRKC